KRSARRGSEWEILEGLKDGQRFDKKPDVFTGYLHKKRKWPLKGWHKRYFVVDKGILIYAKGPGDIARGKIHGSVDIGLSVISTKGKRKRLDIDAEEFIYHLKTLESFLKWVEQLKQHRLYRQHLLTFGTREVPVIRAQGSSAEDDSPNRTRGLNMYEMYESLSKTNHDGSLPRNVKPCSPPPSILGAGAAIDTLGKELGQVTQNIAQLTRILEQIESIPTIDTEASGSPSDRKKFGLRKKKSSKVSFPGTEQQPATGGLSSSNSSLPTTTLATRPQSLPGPEHLLPLAVNAVTSTPDNQIREDFTILAKDIVGPGSVFQRTCLKLALYTLSTERDRLKTALESDSTILLNTGSSISSATGNMVASLRNSLNQALQQNADLRSRLARIHDTADLSDISSVGPASEVMQKPLHTSLSYSSSCVSASEFFDAEEYELHHDGQGGRDGSDTSSEAGSLTSEEGSVSSENSEIGTEYTPAQSLAGGTGVSNMKCMTGRRTKLPAPRPDTEGLSLWNLLCKNIGKDLSQVSMPVALNEPLNMLQRMCEELEYSELLDKAAEVDDPYERMVYIAAFAVSSYGSSYFRAGSKPFNPLLGETYECIREDKGFRFIAEQ
ncbi:hypothetical protein L9F63_002640, partial [Diploptera punctata]